MIPKANEVYRHFKGNLYKVVGVATHSETEESMVVYQALYGDFKLYVRPLESFISPVDTVKYPNVKQKRRFELIGVSAADKEDEAPVQVATPKEVAEPVRNMEPVQADVQRVEAPSMQVEEPVIQSPQSANLKPLVEAFLDADTVDERRRILVALQDTVTQDEITIMATVMDIEIDRELELPERFRQLMKCLDTKSRYETLRLR